MPVHADEKVTIKTWGVNRHVIDEIIPLRGKYPLKKCYEECMRNIGGIGARTLYLVGREQTALRIIREHAAKLGNAEVLTENYAPWVESKIPPASEAINKPSAIELKNLQRASALGFVPAKLKLARVLLTGNFTPQGMDIATARILLNE